MKYGIIVIEQDNTANGLTHFANGSWFFDRDFDKLQTYNNFEDAQQVTYDIMDATSKYKYAMVVSYPVAIGQLTDAELVNQDHERWDGMS